MNKIEMLELRLEGLTYKEIGRRVGISRQRVQQLLSPPTDVRDIIIAKYSGKCNKCGVIVGSSGHVHHGNSDIEDYNDIDNLTLLCLACHRKEHKQPHKSPIRKVKDNSRNEDMLRLRLEGKSHAEIAKMSTEQGRPITKQGVQWILKQFPVSKVYVLDGNKCTQGSTQGSSQRGVKAILDKIVLKVRKFL